jgi:hypothetical protein
MAQQFLSPDVMATIPKSFNVQYTPESSQMFGRSYVTTPAQYGSDINIPGLTPTFEDQTFGRGTHKVFTGFTAPIDIPGQSETDSNGHPMPRMFANYDTQGNLLKIQPERPYQINDNVMIQPEINAKGELVDSRAQSAHQNEGGLGSFFSDFVKDLSPILLAGLGANLYGGMNLLGGAGGGLGGLGGAAGAGGNAGALINAGMGGLDAQVASALANQAVTGGALDAAVAAGGGLTPSVSNFMDPKLLSNAGGLPEIPTYPEIPLPERPVVSSEFNGPPTPEPSIPPETPVPPAPPETPVPPSSSDVLPPEDPTPPTPPSSSDVPPPEDPTPPPSSSDVPPPEDPSPPAPPKSPLTEYQDLLKNAGDLLSKIGSIGGGSAKGGAGDFGSLKFGESYLPGVSTSQSTPSMVQLKEQAIVPALAAVLQQRGMNLSQPSYAGGGKVANLSYAYGGLPQHANTEHRPEFITGKTGHYAQGRGTGQSDDIPAVLHDGDYVMDADTVAAFGDGSSKAGAGALEHFRRSIPEHHSGGGQPIRAQIADGEYVLPAGFVTTLGQGSNKNGAKMLDAMREQIRSHKRSAPDTKIPPKAKSPLQYMNEAMKG